MRLAVVIIMFVLTELLTEQCKPEKKETTNVQSARRQLRRWRQRFEVRVQEMEIFGEREMRILLDGVVLLRNNEVSNVVKRGYVKSKGCSTRKVVTGLKGTFTGASRRKTSKCLDSLPQTDHCRPLFTNKLPMKTIKATQVQERHQVDLVVLSKFAVYTNYHYVLSVLDVFSRYLWLRPLRRKSSHSVMKRLKEIYSKEGAPRIIQSDQGTEFKKYVKRFCEQYGIHMIRSRPYHPQSQGKIESSHRVWTRKLKFDLAHKPNDFDLERKLQEYARIYNLELHESLKQRPADVYFGRCLNCLDASGFSFCRSNFGSKDESVSIRDKALKNAEMSAQRMIKRHALRFPPAYYFVGDNVLIKQSKSSKKTCPVIKGFILKTMYSKQMYKVRSNDMMKDKWLSVSQLVAESRAVEQDRKLCGKIYRSRLRYPCQCESSECRSEATRFCSNFMVKFCCRRSQKRCRLKHHNIKTKLDIRQFDTHLDSSDTFKFIQTISYFQHKKRMSGLTDHDRVVTNAMTLNLIPDGTTPSDGNCMFHAIAAGLSEINGSPYSQQMVRSEIANWLRNNEFFNDVFFPDYTYDQDWEEYLQGIEDNEWGDHLCLVAAANVFDIGLTIISSEHTNPTFIYSSGTTEQTGFNPNRVVYLGHEAEMHYIRLVSLNLPASSTELVTEPSRENPLVETTTHLCDLPGELLMKIFKEAFVSDNTAYGSLMGAWTESEAVRELISNSCKPKLYVRDSVYHHMEPSRSRCPGQLYEWSIRKLYRYSGKSSGLALELKRLLKMFPNWFNALILLIALEQVGWFEISNVSVRER